MEEAMKMRHRETGKFIAMDPERIRQGHDIVF